MNLKVLRALQAITGEFLATKTVRVIVSLRLSVHCANEYLK